VIFVNIAKKRVCYTFWYVGRIPPPLPLKFLAKKLKLRENIARAGQKCEVFLLILFMISYPQPGEAFFIWRMP
jgi:hypothetical protein